MTAPLDSILSKRLIFVTGKGGVGKTTVSTALGLLAARRGLRTLICEVEPKGEVSRFFGIKSGGFVPVNVAENLDVMEMSTEAALYEYLKLYLRLPIPVRLTPLAKTFDFVANAAPGVREILVVGKLCYEVRERHYDVVLADASSSGHIVSQLSSPQGVGDLFPIGLVRDQTDWMLEILADREQTGICLVATAEETPIEESLELNQRLKEQTVVSLVAAIVNKVIPSVFSNLERTTFEGLSALLDAGVELGALDGLANLIEATRLWSSLGERQESLIQRLRSALPKQTPFAVVPTIPGVHVGLSVVTEVAETLEVELSL
jgi:anion-transporting  ArsA/GET3 family ATPase